MRTFRWFVSFNSLEYGNLLVLKLILPFWRRLKGVDFLALICIPSLPLFRLHWLKALLLIVGCFNFKVKRSLLEIELLSWELKRVENISFYWFSLSLAYLTWIYNDSLKLYACSIVLKMRHNVEGKPLHIPFTYKSFRTWTDNRR